MPADNAGDPKTTVAMPELGHSPGSIRRMALDALGSDQSDGQEPAPDAWNADAPDPEGAQLSGDEALEAEPGDPLAEGVDLGEEDAPGEAEVEEKGAPEQRLASDDDMVDIDGEKVTIKELKLGRLRQQDYTRKTTELANKRREAEALKASVADEQKSMRDYLNGIFSDPRALIEQLQIYMRPEHIYGLANDLWQDAYSLTQLEDKELSREMRYRELDRQEKLRQIRSQTEAKQAESNKQAEAVKARRERYGRVVPGLLKEVGVPLVDGNDSYNRDVIHLLNSHAIALHGEQTEYSDEELRAAAQSMADSPAGRLLASAGGLGSLSTEQLATQLGEDGRKKLRAYEAQLLKEQQKRSGSKGAATAGNGRQGPPPKRTMTFDELRLKYR